jgi:2,3-bisphosphoglycerate-dependent phosphoglycerate mutase
MTTFLSALTGFFLFFSSIQTQGVTDALSVASVEPSTFVVVRHAEKVDSSTDPDLSEAGLQRATRLAAVLQYMQIDGLHSTPFKRTWQTLGVLAETRGLTVQEYDPRNPNPFLDVAKSEYGKIHVIAGHSNTAPVIVNYLSGNTVYTELGDDVYDHLWIVHCYPDGTSKTILLHY